MTDARMIRVMIVDDHVMVRHGLVTFLELHDDIEIVAMASNAVDALEKLPLCSPDVILMDLIMPDMSGVDAIRQIRKRDSQQIIIAPTISNKELVRSALEAGALPLGNKQMWCWCMITGTSRVCVALFDVDKLFTGTVI